MNEVSENIKMFTKECQHVIECSSSLQLGKRVAMSWKGLTRREPWQSLKGREGTLIPQRREVYTRQWTDRRQVWAMEHLISWLTSPCKVKWSESRSLVSNSLRPHGRNSLGQNTGVGSLFLLQQIFPTQELNWGLLHCRWIPYQLSYQGSLKPM